MMLLLLAVQIDWKDPAPPDVVQLEAMTPPKARDFPGRTFVAPPRPLAPAAETEDWPGFLGPLRDGVSRETGILMDWPEGGPKLVWSVERGSGYASPAVQGDRLVFPHREGNQVHVDCLQAETGERFWRFSYPCDYRGRYISNAGPRATPEIDGDRVYVHGVEGMLHCLELTTGRVIWKRDLHAEFDLPQAFFGVVASPLVSGDQLIVNVGAPGPTVAAFDKATGRLVWASGDDWGPGCASPIRASIGGRDRLLVLAGGDTRPPTGGLLILDPRTGSEDFRYPFRSRTYESVNGATPLIVGDRVFLTASYSTGTAAIDFDEERGFAESWKTRNVGIEFSNPLYIGDHLYLLDGIHGRAGAIVCVDPATGDVLSRTDFDWMEKVVDEGVEKELSFSIGAGSFLHVAERLLVLGDLGHLLWVEPQPEGCRLLERATLFHSTESWTPLVLSRGLLYVCQNNRERFGIDPQPPRLLCYDFRSDE